MMAGLFLVAQAARLCLRGGHASGRTRSLPSAGVSVVTLRQDTASGSVRRPLAPVCYAPGGRGPRDVRDSPDGGTAAVASILQHVVAGLLPRHGVPRRYGERPVG